MRKASEDPRHGPSLQDPRYSQSLERGLAILTTFTPERPVLGIAEISDQLGMSRSTTHRYVATLVALGYLEQRASKKYCLALRVTDLGMSALAMTGLREHSHALLEELRRRSTHTTNLAILDATEIVYVDRARSFRAGQSKIDLSLRRGSRLPAHCTALGKVLLASLPKDDLEELIGKMDLTKRGPGSITDKRALSAELRRVANQGFALSDEEVARGLISIAAPVRSESGEVIASINLEAHVSMASLEEIVNRNKGMLLATAEKLSERLGLREGS